MRNIILGLAVSLDGYIEGPNGEYDWCFTDQDYGMSEFFKRVDAMFVGRKSYDVLSAQENVGGFPKLKQYIFSNTLTSVPSEAILIKSNGGDLHSQVNAIQREPGKDIWLFGGAALTSSLMNLRLIDELWLSVHPILLGSGKPLFRNVRGRIPLLHAETKTYSSGLVSLTYRLRT
jgi:dihydrofolate reductase